MHTIAELACGQEKSKALVTVSVFKRWFVLFAALYPCPYCRHHLNRYVALGKERELYPVEYLFLGWKSPNDNPQGVVTIQDKTDYIVDGETLRLFLWKLHNSVNSSIARTEDWYHTDQQALYTSRYWPNIDAETLRARGIGIGLLSSARMEKIVDILKIGTRLSKAREIIVSSEHSQEQYNKMVESVNKLIYQLDGAVVDGGFLQEVYSYNARILDQDPQPASTLDEAAFIRQEDFTLS